MTTQTRTPRQHQHNPQHVLAILILVVGSMLLLSVGALWNTLFPHTYQPQPFHVEAPMAVPQIVNGQVGTIVLESYTLVTNPYQGGCAAVETFITMFSAQEVRCYKTLEIPPVSVVANTPLGLSAEQVSAVMARPDGVLYMHSTGERLGADAAYFHIGTDVYLAVWVAGDCTPRIFNGAGGYWQMPVSPTFHAAENVPFGPGYLVTLPPNWQTEWARNANQTTGWRTCAAQSFPQGGS